MPDRVSLEEFLRQLRDSREQARPRLRCSSYALERYRDGIYLLPANGADPPQPFSLTPGEIRQVPGVGRVALQRASGEGLHLAENERLQLAWRTGGERCKPQGRAGSASLKKLLQEQDIPPWWRDRVPLLYLGDELLAVGDLWCCESSRWRGPAQGGESLWQLSWLPNMDTAFD
jgi:tRNA(Ile)-lysidine synthase